MKTKATKNSTSKKFRSNHFYLNALKTKSPQDMEILYRDHFDMVKNLIVKSGGNHTEASDIFQEALIVLFSKVQAGNLKLTCQFRTFLFRVCRNLWLKSLHKSEKSVTMDDFSFIEYEDQAEAERLELLLQRKELLAEKLNMLKKDEKKLLELFFSGEKMKEIAIKMGYGSAGYAKKKKSLIKNKLVALIQNDYKFSDLAY